MICADELGPVIPRSFPPAPGWTADGHRVKALLDYRRGPEQDLGGRRAGGRRRAAGDDDRTSRNSIGSQQLLAAVETANPAGTIVVITDNHVQPPQRLDPCLAGRPPRIQPALIPKGPAGSTSRKAGGGWFAARPWPASRSPP